MSDSTSRHDVANEHGVFEDRLVDRRRFLVKLGSMSAVGAALLTLGESASGMALGLARSATAGAAAPRPIYMVCLGDSVMWGQGLAEDQKFQAKVQRWIEQSNPNRRMVRRWNFAHSGASLGSLTGLEAAASGTGRMTAAAFSHVARAHPGQRDYQDIPDYVPPRLDSTRTTPRSSGPVENGRPHEPAEGDVLGGEIPRTYPTLWRQLDLALQTLRTGKDPRNALSPASSPVDPAEVDLVLLNGGANDIGFVDTILNVFRNSQQTYDHVRSVVEPRMRAYLPEAMKAFPNATVVLTTYYRGISMRSSPGIVTPFVQWYGTTLAVTNPLAAHLAENQIGAVVGRNDAMERAILDSYRAAVEASGAAPGRVLIISPDFAPENAYGATQRFVFHVEDTDPAESGRHAECNRLLGQWLGDLGALAANGSTPERADTPLWAMCNEASAFHPNPAGANRYFEKIRAALLTAQPAFMRPLPTLRVQVSGSTAGDTKTVTVNAFDAATGSAVQGTVLVGGVSGRTGTPLSYKAGCGLEDAAAPVQVANAKGAVRTLPVRRPAVPAACSGSVTVPGYADATFRY